eukprot:660216-Prymnesium_polylepis.1
MEITRGRRMGVVWAHVGSYEGHNGISCPSFDVTFGSHGVTQGSHRGHAGVTWTWTWTRTWTWGHMRVTCVSHARHVGRHLPLGGGHRRDAALARARDADAEGGLDRHVRLALHEQLPHLRSGGGQVGVRWVSDG